MAANNSVANMSSTIPTQFSHSNSDSQSLARTQLAATIHKSTTKNNNNFNNTTTTNNSKSTTSTHPFLQSKFQIGSSRTTRTDFDVSERVFHRNDIPPKGRVAREEIHAFLHGNNPGGKKPWNFASVSGTNIRGLLGASWDSDSWDDRYYARIQSNYLIQKAQNRINLIRQGIDPDEDAKNIHSNRWNVSTKFYENSWVDENQMKLSSTTYKKKDIYSSTASLLTKMEQYKKQPNNYINLSERESIYMDQERNRKREELESKQKLTQKEIETLLWKEAEKWAYT